MSVGRPVLALWTALVLASASTACTPKDGEGESTNSPDATDSSSAAATESSQDTASAETHAASGSTAASAGESSAEHSTDSAASGDEESSGADADFARVLAVEVSGDAMDYRFAVTLQSPDTGCDRYANWWEVLDEAGTLLYRRILAHSHVDEQPFTRSGGPIPIPADRVVIVRGHMNDRGYSDQVFRGTAAAGFSEASMPDFAASVESMPPQPGECPN